MEEQSSQGQACEVQEAEGRILGLVGWVALGIMMAVGLTSVVLTLFRVAVAERFADGPDEVARVGISVAVTAFLLAMVAMSLFLTFITMVQILYALPSPLVYLAPIFWLLFFGYAYVMARYRSGYLGRLAHEQWVGGHPAETVELYARAFRERSWILILAIAPLILVLISRVFFFGALGPVEELPPGMNWR